MANALLVGDIVLVKTFCSSASQVAVNTRFYHVDDIGAGGITDQDVANDMEDGVAQAYKPLLTAAATFRGIQLQVLHPRLLVPVIANANAGVGTGGASPLPLHVAGLIKLGTNLGGKANRGRQYIPFPAEEANDAIGNPSAAYITALTTLATGLVSLQTTTVGGTTLTMAPVVFHRLTSTWTRIITATPREFWATQRRRAALTGGDGPIPV